MKRIASISLVLFSLVAASCHKKHTCTCVKVEGIYNPDTLYYAIPPMKNKLAAADCNAKAYQFYGVIYSCSLD